MIRLEAHSLRLTLSPQRGGTLLSLDWHHPDRGWVALLEPLADPAAGLRAGCFVMAPFANRIADARFAFGGVTHDLPMNRPEEGMAIHGVARDHAWTVEETGTDGALLCLRVAAPDLPWRFVLRQRLTLSPDVLEVGLEMTNLGDAPLPFGMGLHPWFRKPAGATLSLRQPRSQHRDLRGLPLPRTEAHPEFATATARPLAGIPWFDGIFAQWSPREALIRYPADESEIRLSAKGALRHLHVFVPDDRPVFCAEPVSHLPDTVNRPGLPPMDVLAPGGTLSGAMTLWARACPAVHQEVSP